MQRTRSGIVAWRKHLAVAGLIGVVVGAPGGDALPADGNPPREFVTVVGRAYQRVDLTVTVTDRRGRPIRGLGAGDFVVFEDDRPMALADFGVEGDRRDRPLSVAILLDFSASMGSQIRDVRLAARALLTRLRPQDEIMVAKFNDQVTVLQTFTGDLDDPDRTLKNIGRAWGGTNLFRSIEEALKDLRGRRGRKIILVISDGLDNRLSRHGHVLQSLYLQDLLRLCFRTGTVVYGVRPGMSAHSWLPFEGFVAETGGRMLYSGGDLERLFAQLGEEFLSQYYLAYDIDPQHKEGKRRRIRVETTRTDVVLRTMRGYFTPESHLDTLLRDLDDRDEEMRSDAAYELGFISDPEAVVGLRAALRDRSPAVRRMAAGALGRQGDESAIMPLFAALGDRSEEVRRESFDALALFGMSTLPPAILEIQRGASRRRAAPRLLLAASLAGRVGDDRAIEPLALLLTSRPVEARVAAARALGDLGLSGGIPALRDRLEDKQPEVRQAALRSIVLIAGPAARAVVEDYLRREADPGLKHLARTLLGSLQREPDRQEPATNSPRSADGEPANQIE